MVRPALAGETRDDQWREDLDYFHTTLPRKCIAFYQLMPKEEFEKQIAEIKNSVPRLTDEEITLRLARIMAGLGVAHAWAEADSIGFHRYPLELHWFSDGLVIVAAAPEYKDALGARVLSIGGTTPEQIEALAAPYVPHENAAWLHARAARDMTVVELMQLLGIAGADQRMQLTLAKLDGKPFTLWVSPAARGATMVSVEQALYIPPPLYASRQGNYWYQYLPDSQTLYLQYSDCDNDPKYPFKDFARDLFAFADSHAIARTVIDLRFDPGGNSEVGDPLVAGIRSRPALNAKGRLFVLIGPMTCSSGELMAEEFHNSFVFLTGKLTDGFYWVSPENPGEPVTPFNATLVGEPTGGKPNCYGDVGTFQLPNSKITIAYPTKHFELTTEGDPLTREPDVLVTRSWKDYLTGRDPVLETVLREPLP
jgi:hypothetical protein